MKPLKILTVIGTRPEAIKMVPVLRALARRQNIESKLCVTGQHRRMMDQVLAQFDISPSHDLKLMLPGQSLTDITCGVLQALDPVIKSGKPDWILVHGDTTTTMAASLAAFYRRIPVAHVEAGLRTGDLSAPWPEEANRKITDSLAKVFFAPTPGARANLLRENVPEWSVVVTGNTVVDMIQHTVRLFEDRPGLTKSVEATLPSLDISKPLLLVTGHRRENFGLGFQNICSALATLAKSEDVEIVYPVHLNPAVRDPVMRELGGTPNIHLLEPIDYFPFVLLMQRCHLILTDSGGVQEEAPALGKPVLVMRDVTERPEAIEAGSARLVGTNTDTIIEATRSLLHDPKAHRLMASVRNPFGDGHAGERIADYFQNCPATPGFTL